MSEEIVETQVFVVEDQGVVRSMLTRYLDLQPGIAVCGSAATGEEALGALPGEAEVIVVDLGLAGMTGTELLTEVRARWPGLACVVLSGRTALESEAEALRAGADAFVEKGDLPQLMAAIREAAARRVEDPKSS